MVDKQSQLLTKEDISKEGATIGHIIEEYLDPGASSPAPFQHPAFMCLLLLQEKAQSPSSDGFVCDKSTGDGLSTTNPTAGTVKNLFQ